MYMYIITGSCHVQSYYLTVSVTACFVPVTAVGLGNCDKTNLDLTGYATIFSAHANGAHCADWRSTARNARVQQDQDVAVYDSELCPSEPF